MLTNIQATLPGNLFSDEISATFSPTAEAPSSIYKHHKHAVRYKTFTSLQCPNAKSQCSTRLSSCRHQTISDLTTERNSIDCRLIMKAFKAGSLGEFFVRTNFGSKAWLALQNLQIPQGSMNRTIREWLFPTLFPTKQRHGQLSRRYINRNAYQNKKCTRCPP